mgnify:CR=1 FL=1
MVFPQQPAHRISDLEKSDLEKSDLEKSDPVKGDLARSNRVERDFSYVWMEAR